MTIAVLDHGSGNLHSVGRALMQVGGDVEVTADPRRIDDASALVIPGVGHFGTCMRAITRLGMDRVIRDHAAAGRPVFGVCVGMQVLFEGSDEDGEPGLGILPGRVGRLPDDVKVPHMGWNSVTWSRSHPYVDGIDDGTRFYFVHSYAPQAEPAMNVALTEHGRTFTSAVAAGSVFATQFHPEKSGNVGLRLYRNFVEAVA